MSEEITSCSISRITDIFSRGAGQGMCDKDIPSLVLTRRYIGNALPDTVFQVVSRVLCPGVTNFNPGPMFYFQNRTADFEFFGIGTAATFSAPSLDEWRIRHEGVIEALREHPSGRDICLVGGTSFDGMQPSGVWSEFGGAFFFIPKHYLMRRQGVVEEFSVVGGYGEEEQADIDDIFRSALNSSRGDCAGLAANIEGVTSSVVSNEENNQCRPFLWSESYPLYDTWRVGVGRALEAISADQLQKVVLARESVSSTVANSRLATSVLSFLGAANSTTRFYFSPRGGAVFFGSTPELLFSLRGTSFTSEALAGTLSAATDDSIFVGPKEMQEHRIVVAAIVEKLRSLAGRVEAAEEPRLLDLRDFYHLVTPITAELLGQISPIDLIALLHPTPAVCGTPTTVALDFIREHESFDRGWYAGTIGYVIGDSAEFAVNLRCGLIKDENLRVYVGAGIVEGSTAEREWEELNLKQRRIEASFRKAL